MSAIEPAGEKIVRNLQQAVERLQDDIARVELWAGALGCFAKPIPGYGHGQTRFDLPAPDEQTEQLNFDISPHRNAVSQIGSPQGNQAKKNSRESRFGAPRQQIFRAFFHPSRPSKTATESTY